MRLFIRAAPTAPWLPFLFSALLTLMGMLHASPGLAQGETPTWVTALPDSDAIPNFFLAIDKDRQSFFVMERHSPLRITRTLPCTTGQKAGDKLVEGDLRTPEGVYFVQRKLTSGLDYGLYGDMAFTLNFPNPVDRIKGKTGYGIWIHGRGDAIVPRETRGCVALNNPDIHSLAPRLARGTPVVIARGLTWPPDVSLRGIEAVSVTSRARDWAAAWQDKCSTFFEFYDPARFDIADRQGFAAFAANKRHHFRRQPWIRVMLDNVTALPGPDYWVTSFDQLYLAPGVVSETRKRLYWQRGEGGDWVIVGREYDLPSRGLADKYLATLRPEIEAALEHWRKSWLAADVDAYAANYAADANQQGRRGRDTIGAHKRKLWQGAPPKSIEFEDLRVDIGSHGIEASFVQRYSAVGGYADTGVKRVTFVPDGEAWRIAAETWRASK